MRRNWRSRPSFRLFSVLMAVYCIIPVVFYLSPQFRRILIFGAYIIWPFHDYTKPESYGLPHAKNFFINSVGEIRLGTWYIPPRSLWNQLENVSKSREPEPWMFQDQRPVIIYFHGHANCRACQYRIGLYKTLSQSNKLDAHVFTIDYRGFADSTKVLPDREGVLHDAIVTFDYVRKLLKNNESRILIWGHSLGTGVAMQLADAFTELKRSPMGVVLEAPFNSLVEASMEWPLGRIFKYFPGSSIIFGTLRDNDETFFESEQLAASVRLPILILHSTDDGLVPYRLGQKLLDRLRAMCPVQPTFYKVNDTYGPGHRYIYTDPGMQTAVADFIRSLGKAELPIVEEKPTDKSSVSERKDGIAVPSAISKTDSTPVEHRNSEEL
ncbi:fasciclin-1-like [Tropilaelaps mercedesae]|uniref:Fasciclin-1-like n=1 Tax=Tropilaelaps mercedesae TaxID=418985 RepID=A0A1V9XSA7_9ACAR|nr:fasciclin-1-like [Tropilaelaps mercedesae]